MRKLRKLYLVLCRKSVYITRIKPWIEVIGIIVLIFYTIFAGKQASQMRRANRIAVNTFNAIDRPFIGVAGMTCIFSARDAKGKPGPALPTTAQAMRYIAEIKNFGPVSGTNFTVKWKVTISGAQVTPAKKVPDRPSTVFPSQVIELAGDVGPQFYPEILDGTKTLIAEITIQYDGPSSHYKECSKQQYAPWAANFINLGAQCSP